MPAPAAAAARGRAGQPRDKSHQRPTTSRGSHPGVPRARSTAI